MGMYGGEGFVIGGVDECDCLFDVFVFCLYLVCIDVLGDVVGFVFDDVGLMDCVEQLCFIVVDVIYDGDYWRMDFEVVFVFFFQFFFQVEIEVFEEFFVFIFGRDYLDFVVEFFVEDFECCFVQ